MPKKQEESDHNVHLKQSYLEQSLQYVTEEFVQKLRELSLVKRISDALVDTADQKKVFLDITTIILDEIHAETCSLYLLNAKKNKLFLRSVGRQAESEGIFFDNEKENVQSASEGLAGAVLESRKSLYIKNSRRDKRFSGDPLFPENMDSILCLPLISDEDIIGIFVLSAPESHTFAREDQNLLQIIANQIANVLRNVELVRKIQKAYEKQEHVLKKLKSAEKKLSNYTKDLESIVEKRTNELVQSEKLASVGQLVAGVAHELNNPLTIIIGLIELMVDSDDLPIRHKKRLNKVHGATMRCAKVVNNLLKFYRKEKIQKKDININKIIGETLGFFEYQFLVNNISVLKSLQSNMPVTVGDPQQLQQVFLNIISNAYDAMAFQDSNKTLEVKTHTDENTIIVEFRDTGPGIPKNSQKKLFEPFFTTKEVGRGTGLGLSLSYGIIKEHNGEIFLDSSYTEGAKFTLLFPIVAGEETHEQKKAVKNSLSSTTRVLIIDDESDIIEFQKEVLKIYTCIPEVAYDG